MDNAGYELYQNFPNPFNPKTIINFNIPISANVSLKVYDVLGNEVTTLIDEKKSPGNYSVEFDGSSFAGGLPSGIYFYTLSVSSGKEGFMDTKRMILLK